MVKPLSGKQYNNSAKKRMMMRMATVSGAQKEIFYTRNEGLEDEVKVKYLLQHPGVRKALSIQNEFFDTDSGKIDMNLKYDALMKNVIFKEDLKRTSWDYWEEVGIEESDFVLKEASKFLSGKSA